LKTLIKKVKNLDLNMNTGRKVSLPQPSPSQLWERNPEAIFIALGNLRYEKNPDFE
jgi:hypothetical protein